MKNTLLIALCLALVGCSSAPAKGPCPCEHLKNCVCDYETGEYSYSPDGCNTARCDAYGRCAITAMACLRDWRKP